MRLVGLHRSPSWACIVTDTSLQGCPCTPWTLESSVALHGLNLISRDTRLAQAEDLPHGKPHLAPPRPFSPPPFRAHESTLGATVSSLGWGSPPSMLDCPARSRVVYSRLPEERPRRAGTNQLRLVPSMRSLTASTCCSYPSLQAICVLLTVMGFGTFQGSRDVRIAPSAIAPYSRTAIRTLRRIPLVDSRTASPRPLPPWRSARLRDPRPHRRGGYCSVPLHPKALQLSLPGWPITSRLPARTYPWPLGGLPYRKGPPIDPKVSEQAPVCRT